MRGCQGAGRSTAPNGHEACSKGSPSPHRHGGQQAIEPPTADRAIAWASAAHATRLPRLSRHAQTNPEGSRGKKKGGDDAGRGRSPRLHDCTAKQLRRAPTNIDATVDSRISRGSPEKRKRFFYPYGSSTRKQLLAAYENASNSESSRVSRHSLLGASEAGNGSLYTMILQTPFC